MRAIRFTSIGLLGILLLCSIHTVASAADSIDAIDDLELDSGLDLDMPVLEDSMNDVKIGKPAQRSTGAKKHVRLSFAYQLGSQFDDLSEIVSNRLDTRARWESLFGEHYYASLDAKLILRSWKDQQLEAGKDVSIEARAREAALQASYGAFSIKAGYQVSIWGEMDSARITDVLSPWDYSEFAFTSPEDARVGQPSILLDGFFANSKLGIVFTPLPLVNRYPSGDASGLLSYILGTDQFVIKEYAPEFGSDYELGIRFKHTLGSGDIAFYGARVISDDPLFELDPDAAGPDPVFDIRYPEYELLGFTANYAQGNFLWKTELAFKNNLYFPSQTSIIRDTMEVAAGLDYSANGAYSLTLELQNQRILPGEGALVGLKTDNSQAMLRWSKNFFHETLSAVYFASYQIQYGDTTHSTALQYAVSDFWRVDLNFTVFDVKNQDSPQKFIDDWDQVSIRATLEI